MKKTSHCIILFMFILFQVSFCEEVDDLKKNIKQIDESIGTKNKRIQIIDVQRNTEKKRMAQIEQDIKKIKKEKNLIDEEIQEVLKNIDYAEKSFKISRGELENVSATIGYQMIFWNKYTIAKSENNISEEARKTMSRLVNSELQRVEKVKDVQADISKAKVDVEKEKQKLVVLQKRAIENSKNLANKIKEKEALIAKLNKEKSTHEIDIKNLRAKKAQIESAIQNILSQKVKIDKNLSYASAKIQVGKMSKPIAGQVVTKFGELKNTIATNGIEIKGDLGAEVKAATAGKVIYSGDFLGLGKVVMIDYGYNLIGVYGNLIATTVGIGGIVIKGQPIGVLGYSNDGQPNLYYEQRFKLKAINPLEFF